MCGTVSAAKTRTGDEAAAAKPRRSEDPLGQGQRFSTTVDGFAVTDSLAGIAPPLEVGGEQAAHQVGAEAQAHDEAPQRVEPCDVRVLVQ